jgi:hypothetical protein
MKAKSSTSHSGLERGAAPSWHEAAEFSRRVEVDDILATGLDLTIDASAAESAALARRAGLPAVLSLAADFHLRKLEASRVEVVGMLRARVVQICVVSLDPFETDIACPIEVTFSGKVEPIAAPRNRSDLCDRSGTSRLGSAALDGPDPIIGGRIDLGALAAEFLMLSLEPYPRMPGVAFDETGLVPTGPETVSPFAALRKLKGSANKEG